MANSPDELPPALMPRVASQHGSTLLVREDPASLRRIASDWALLRRPVVLFAWLGCLLLLPYPVLLTGSVRWFAAAIALCSLVQFLAILAVCTRTTHRVELLLPFVVYVVFQNVLIGPFVRQDTSLSLIRAAFEMKTYYLIVLLAGLGVPALRDAADREAARQLVNLPTILACALAVAALGWAIAAPHNTPLLSRLAYLRDLALPAALVVVAQYVTRSRHDIAILTKFILLVGMIVVAFGLVERLFLGDWFWRGIMHADRVWYAKQGTPWQWMLPGETPVLGHRVRRLASTFLDGVNTALFLAAVIGVLLAAPVKRFKWLALLTTSTALVLTLGRGGIVIAGLTGVAYAAWQSRSYRWRAIAIVSSPVALAALVFAAVESAVGAHFVGLSSGLSTLPTHPLGNGLGTGGNFAQIAGYVTTREAWLASGGESAVGSIAYQMGFPGLMLWLGFVAATAGLLFRAAVREKALARPAGAYAFVAAALLVGLMWSSFGQESALSPPGNFLYFVLAGCVLKAVTVQPDSPSPPSEQVDGPPPVGARAHSTPVS